MRLHWLHFNYLPLHCHQQSINSLLGLHSHIVSLHRSYLSSFIEMHSQSIILPRTRHFDHLPVARRTVATMRWPTPSPPLPPQIVCALINAIARSAIAMPKWEECGICGVCNVERATNNETVLNVHLLFCGNCKCNCVLPQRKSRRKDAKGQVGQLPKGWWHGGKGAGDSAAAAEMSNGRPYFLNAKYFLT